MANNASQERMATKRAASDADGLQNTEPKIRKTAGRSKSNPFRSLPQLSTTTKKPSRKTGSAMSTTKPPPAFSCNGCGKRSSTSDFAMHPPCDDPHKIVFCLTCTRTQLLSALGEGDIRHASCPTCQSYWTSSFLKGLLSADEMKTYHEMAKSHPHYRSCVAEGCIHGQIHPPGLKQPIVTCEECGTQSCFGHRVPWHTGYSCAQYYDHVMENQLSKDQSNPRQPEIKREYSKEQCPDCGKHPTFSSDSKSILECQECESKFCGECLVNMKGIQKHGMHQHKTSCKFWASKGWDEDGDVKRGLAQLAKSVDDHKRHMQSFQQHLAHHSAGVLAFGATLPPLPGYLHPATGHEPLGDIPVAGEMPLDSVIEEEIAGDYDDD